MTTTHSERVSPNPLERLSSLPGQEQIGDVFQRSVGSYNNFLTSLLNAQSRLSLAIAEMDSWLRRIRLVRIK